MKSCHSPEISGRLGLLGFKANRPLDAEGSTPPTSLFEKTSCDKRTCKERDKHIPLTTGKVIPADIFLWDPSPQSQRCHRFLVALCPPCFPATPHLKNHAVHVRSQPKSLDSRWLIFPGTRAHPIPSSPAQLHRQLYPLQKPWQYLMGKKRTPPGHNLRSGSFRRIM